jgi:hypothetical protein
MKLQLQHTKFIPGDGLLIEQETGDKHEKYRLTDAGITDDESGWWYFFRKYEDKESPYVYRKKRKEPTKNDPGGEVVEEYVGLEFPFTIPREWVSKLRRRATK